MPALHMFKHPKIFIFANCIYIFKIPLNVCTSNTGYNWVWGDRKAEGTGGGGGVQGIGV